MSSDFVTFEIAAFSLNRLEQSINEILEKLDLNGKKEVPHYHKETEKLLKWLEINLKDIKNLETKLSEEDRLRLQEKISTIRKQSEEAVQRHINIVKDTSNSLLDSPQKQPSGQLVFDYDLLPENDLLSLSTSKDIDQLESDRLVVESSRETFHSLDKDMQELSSLVNTMSGMVVDQSADVTTLETNVSNAQENVVEGKKELLKASWLKSASFPLTGALIGGILGGPVGLIVGIKAGGLVAVGGGLLGYTSGKFIREKRRPKPAADVNILSGRASSL